MPLSRDVGWLPVVISYSNGASQFSFRARICLHRFPRKVLFESGNVCSISPGSLKSLISLVVMAHISAWQCGGNSLDRLAIHPRQVANGGKTKRPLPAFDHREPSTAAPGRFIAGLYSHRRGEHRQPASTLAAEDCSRLRPALARKPCLGNAPAAEGKR
jgi:hypothetical protein